MENELRSPRDGIHRACRDRSRPDRRARGPPGGDPDERPTRTAPPERGPDPARERWRETVRAKALRAPNAEPRSRRLRHRRPATLHARRQRRARRGARPRPPGRVPFTRGVQPTMYRGRFWTMRQYAGFATAEETNRRFRYLLEQGQTGLSVAFDLPTQMGYDSDAPEAEGEVGRVGVPISTRRHGRPPRRAAARRRQHLDDDQRHGGDPARPVRRGGRGARASSVDRIPGPSRTTSSRSTSPGAPRSSRRARRCAS